MCCLKFATRVILVLVKNWKVNNYFDYRKERCPPGEISPSQGILSLWRLSLTRQFLSSRGMQQTKPSAAVKGKSKIVKILDFLGVQGNTKVKVDGSEVDHCQPSRPGSSWACSSTGSWIGFKPILLVCTLIQSFPEPNFSPLYWEGCPSIQSGKSTHASTIKWQQTAMLQLLLQNDIAERSRGEISKEAQVLSKMSWSRNHHQGYISTSGLVIHIKIKLPPIVAV